MAEKIDRIVHTIEESSGSSVIIPDDAFAIIACFAALEAKGVHSVDGNVTRDRIDKLGYKNLSGVKVEVNESTVDVYVSICIQFGYSIPSTAKIIQEKVKNSIESMTGFTVNKVHIKVADLSVA